MTTPTKFGLANIQLTPVMVQIHGPPLVWLNSENSAICAGVMLVFGLPGVNVTELPRGVVKVVDCPAVFAKGKPPVHTPLLNVVMLGPGQLRVNIGMVIGPKENG
jgi:hypothetical protein